MSNEDKVVLELPVICTRGMLVFPGNRLSLDVGRPKSLNAINDGNNLYDKNIVFVSQVNPLDEDPDMRLFIMSEHFAKSKRKLDEITVGLLN